ncbi:copper amine oxidase N-terminal domain-containing protein [Cellulosilyticum lentocellum]|uniref:Copper amine oxidase-like domain-containing protein n=1 Tax=Cellulosilyticum lentocellum (strain ATCC 49066 / DSM 5427 / NCIMB 11756 / RHM5) TaxID=642492 RepID=F2JHT7_CELLD|nr:copper amine oxidase N-terminal domain-containing protein [Cellulosilyticum lentocellum]ADZ85429.1 copper amine oxidase-like domain-containing protein [Cellulosilyticum lentocellum DSM 5427]
MRKGILKWTVMIMMFVMCVPQVFALSEIRVRVNGTQVYFPDGKPYVDSNSRVLVPVRFVSEQLGAKVEWDAAAKRVTIIDGDKVAILNINSKQIMVNGQVKELDTAAIVKGTRTYVPIRFVSEALGATVKYDNKVRIVYIDNGKAPLPEVKVYTSGNFTIPVVEGTKVTDLGGAWNIETPTYASIWFDEEWAQKGNLLILVTPETTKPYSDQCDEIEALLAQDMSISDAKKIMDYARTKTVQHKILTEKVYKTSNYTVKVGSYNESVEIRVIHK